MKKKDLKALKAWSGRVTTGVADSATFLSLFTGGMLDPKKNAVPLMQLAYAMVLDKPILIVSPHGTVIPENVKRVARAVEFFDDGDVDSLHAATLRALKAIGIEPQH